MCVNKEISMDFSKTVNLLKTDFPMRANLNQREPEMLKSWDDQKLYEKMLLKNIGKEQYILHDGPPYANGKIHIGHALNKILKDIIIKYKTMRGYNTPFVPGWDCHGMPIEHKVVELIGPKHKQMQKIDVRKKCKEYALEHIEIQKADFKRLGIQGEWDNPYLTLNPVYESAIIQMFSELVEKDYIYKGLKPVQWCCSCETALADAEVEYEDHKSPSIFVRFKVKNNNGIDLPENTYFVIWTTTPWTLPANVGIAVHPELTYNLFKSSNNFYFAVSELTERVAKKINSENDFEIIKKFKGSELKGILCAHPFIDRDSRVINGDFVTTDTGSGCVHIAPGHGQDDYIAGKEYGLQVISPVDNEGRFTSDFEMMKGIKVFDANPKIIELLKEKAALIGEPEKIEHSYPHCWRCKKPIIFRATAQWFLKVDHNNLRQKLSECIAKDVKWVPDWGKDRIGSMVKVRPDWCLSRQRIWGVPIPVMYCKDCGEVLLEKKNIDYFQKLVEKQGVDCWFTLEPSELLPPETKCKKCGSSIFKKETDILDVWFDSGASHIAVLEKRDYLKSPADLYLEGSDQHRGWFQLSLIPSLATRGRAPFKTVLTHGFVVDEQGRKMSKSLGNVIAPQEIISKFGADILRLWTAYEDYKNDVSIGGDIVNRLVEAYKKIRNTMRFLIINIGDFSNKTDYVQYENMNEIDKWMLAKLNDLSDKVTIAYDEFRFYSIYHAIYNFCVKELSSFYLDIVKERLYLSGAPSQSRRAAQTVIYELLKNITRLIAPILSFTSEEICKFCPDIIENKDSVFLNEWTKLDDKFKNQDILDKWEQIIKIKDDVAKALEVSRQTKGISQSLETKITVYYKHSDFYDYFSENCDELRAALICSEFILHKYDENSSITYDNDGLSAAVIVEKLVHKKCSRCWKYKPEVDSIPEFTGLCAECAETVKKYYDVN